MVRQGYGEPVEAVRNRRAGRAAGEAVGPEHEVVDQQLRASSEELRERRAPFVGLQVVLLVDQEPRQFLTLPGQLRPTRGRAPPPPETLEPSREPLLAGSDLVVGHWSLLLC